MKERFQRLFSPPVFEGDEEKTWRASLLNAAIYTCVFVVLLVVVGNLIGGRTPTSVFILDGIMIAVLFIIRMVLTGGRVSLAGTLLIILGIGLISIASASLGTIRTPTTAFLLLFVIIGGLLFGQRGLVLTTIASSLAVLGLILAENTGLLPKPDTTVTVTQWITYTVAFGLTGMLTNFAYQSTQQALKRVFTEVQERKQSQEAFENLVNNSLQAFVVIQNEQFVFANHEAELLSGYTKEELYAMKPEQVFSLVSEEDREERLQSLQNRLNGEELPSHVQFRINRKDGEIRWLESFTSVINYQGRPAIQAAYLDITKQKQAEEQLRKLSRAVEAAPVSIVITDGKGNIEYVNPYFSKLTGYERSEVIGENPKIMQSGKTSPETYSGLWKTILNGQSWQGEFVNNRKDGSTFIEAALISPIFDKEKNISHFVAIKQDITENREMEKREQEQRALAEALRDTAVAINSFLELENILDTILENINKVVQFDSMHITWFEGEYAKVLRWRGFTPEQEKAMYLNFPLSEYPSFLQVYESRQSLVIPDVQESPFWKPSPETEQVRSHLKVPIIVNQQVTGTLNLHSETPGFYSNNHAQTLEIFADQVGIAVRNSMLFEEVQNLATVDELTGLYNRRGFLEICNREIGRLQRYQRPLSVLFVDIDHFKQFNDRYSYEIGDQVLKLVAKTLKDNVRDIDLVGRYGGEETVILLPEIDQKSAVETAERLRMQIERLRVSSDQGELGVTASFGVATLVPKNKEVIALSEREQGKLLEELIAKAGAALHFAKQEGRNRVILY